VDSHGFCCARNKHPDNDQDIYSGEVSFGFRRLVTTASLIFFSAVALAEDDVSEDKKRSPGNSENTVVVYGDEQSGGLFLSQQRLTSSRDISADGIKMFAAPGGGNAYSAVSALPGVQAQTIDPFGYANPMGGNKGLRVRGTVATHGANGTVEGVPVTGMGPGPGYLWLLEQENLQSVSLTQGAVGADQIDLYSSWGALDSRILWPQENPAASLKYAAGSDSFRRLRVRADSGGLNTGSRLFVSAVKADGDKWRGEGKAVDDQWNLTLALDQSLGNLSAKLLYAQASGAKSDYRALNYEQSRNLDDFYDYDYSADPTDLQNYYRHNRQNFDSKLWLADLTYKLSDSSRIIVRPYYSSEDGYYLSGTPTGMVRRWDMDHEVSGVRTEFQTDVAGTGINVGYWYMTMEPPGPPTSWKMYNPQADGSLTFARWMLLAKVTDEHQLNSAWLKLNRNFRQLNIEGGVRYVKETLPSIDFYNPAGVGDVSYNQALKQSSGVVAARSAKGDDLDIWLPYIAADYDFNAQWNSRISLGRTMGAPAFSSWPQFQSNYSSFNAAGVTAQDVMDKEKMEVVDTLDMALSWSDADASADISIYYSELKNKGVSFYDDTVGVAYSQNVADGHSTGLQLNGQWNFTNGLMLFSNVSWTRAVFDDDMIAAGGTVLDVDGEQLPDVPLWSANTGLSWRQNRLTVMPLLRYTGSRYADSEHKEKVAGYMTVDMTTDYAVPVSSGELLLSFQAVNLTDKRYIGQVNSGDVQTTGAFNYYPGAPRSYLFGAEYCF